MANTMKIKITQKLLDTAKGPKGNYSANQSKLATELFPKKWAKKILGKKVDQAFWDEFLKQKTIDHEGIRIKKLADKEANKAKQKPRHPNKPPYKLKPAALNQLRVLNKQRREANPPVITTKTRTQYGIKRERLKSLDTGYSWSQDNDELGPVYEAHDSAESPVYNDGNKMD